MTEQISRKDRIKVKEAMQQLSVSASSFYSYISYLKVQTYRFKFDPNSYITNVDPK